MCKYVFITFYVRSKFKIKQFDFYSSSIYMGDFFFNTENNILFEIQFERIFTFQVVLLLLDSIDLPVQQLYRAITLRAGNAGGLLERHLTSDRTINQGLASTL